MIKWVSLSVHLERSLVQSILETYVLEVDSLFDNLKWAITLLENVLVNVSLAVCGQSHSGIP